MLCTNKNPAETAAIRARANAYKPNGWVAVSAKNDPAKIRQRIGRAYNFGPRGRFLIEAIHGRLHARWRVCDTGTLVGHDQRPLVLAKHERLPDACLAAVPAVALSLRGFEGSSGLRTTGLGSTSDLACRFGA